MAINLMPTKEIVALSPMHTYQCRHVPIDIREKSGDYHMIDGRPVLSKVALFRIASAAGLIWKETQEVYRSADAICYRATAAVRCEDGTFRTVTGTKEIDLRVIEDEILLKNMKKEAEKKLNGESAEMATRRGMIQWRKDKVARAETGAMMRCIKLAVSLGSYPLQELKEGFDVPVISFTPNFNDPHVQQMLLQQAYGYTSPQVSAPIHRPLLSAPQESDDDIIDAPVIVPEKPKAAEKPALQPPPAQNTKPTEPVKELEKSPTSNALICSKCGVDITEKVATYSQENMGACFCYACQKKVKAA